MEVYEVQTRLWHESQAGTKLKGLFDLLHNPVWILTAARRVMKRSRRKAAGIDKMTVELFERDFERNLKQLRLEVKRGEFRPQPNRRVEIPKSDGRVRLLGIPCLRDKVCQEAVRMILEPVYEPTFSDNSYGFRPSRNTHQAVFECKRLIEEGHPTVIEGDISQCFDSIDHQAILRQLHTKICDSKFVSLVERFLNAGTIVNGVFERSASGTPQGGVVSPLLSNIALHTLDKWLYERNVLFVRYADDFVVFLRNTDRAAAESIKSGIADHLLDSCGLALSPEKTHVTDVRDGFHFLGFHLQGEATTSGDIAVHIEIAQKSIRNFREKIAAAITDLHKPVHSRIMHVNSIIRGWAQAVRIGNDYPAIAVELDTFIASLEKRARLDENTLVKLATFSDINTLQQPVEEIFYGQ